MRFFVVKCFSGNRRVCQTVNTLRRTVHVTGSRGTPRDATGRSARVTNQLKSRMARLHGEEQKSEEVLYC